MQETRKILDDLEKAMQDHNDLLDQVLVIEDKNEFGEDWDFDLNFTWAANFALPGINN